MDRILACVDHLDATPSVVAVAARLAERTGGALRLLHVAPAEPEWVGYGPGPETVREEVAGDLHDVHRRTQALAEPLRERGIDVTPLTVQGPTVESILEQARGWDAEVVVVGAHHKGRIHELFVGSVAKQVLRAADRPILVVPSARS